MWPWMWLAPPGARGVTSPSSAWKPRKRCPPPPGKWKRPSTKALRSSTAGASKRSTPQLKEIVQRVKDLGDKGKMVTDADLIALTSAVMGEVIEEEKIIDLCDMAVVTGIKVIPTASVRLILDGKEYIAAETGVGPVDAVLKAIQKLTSSIENIRLSEYRLEAITGGSNAVAEVVIKVEDEKGNIVSARAAREDIVMASVEAMINGINKCLIKNRKQGNKK